MEVLCYIPRSSSCQRKLCGILNANEARRHLGGFLWRLRLFLLACSFGGRPIELLGFHVRARFAEAVTTQDVLADGAVVFSVKLQKRTVAKYKFRSHILVD